MKKRRKKNTTKTKQPTKNKKNNQQERGDFFWNISLPPRLRASTEHPQRREGSRSPNQKVKIARMEENRCMEKGSEVHGSVAVETPRMEEKKNLQRGYGVQGRVATIIPFPIMTTTMMMTMVTSQEQQNVWAYI